MDEVSSRSDVRVADLSLVDAGFQDIRVTRANLWRIRMRGVWIGEVEIDGAVEACASTASTSGR